MSIVPQIPENAPFNGDQRAWLNGWIAGILATQAHGGAAPALPSAAVVPVTILFGTQTGSSEGLARKISRELRGRGFDPVVYGMDECPKDALPACGRLLVITSTYGEGEPPDNAAAFWQWLAAADAPLLDAVRYSVLALGDTNYEQFCAFGKAVDIRLSELGASRLTDRIDCDVDYDTPFAAWVQSVCASLSSTGGTGVTITEEPPVADTAPEGTRANPCPSWLTENRLLTSPDASKETRHFSLNINGLTYEPGDAIGILPANSGELVQMLLDAGGWSGDEALAHQLLHHADVTNPSRDLLVAVAERAGDSELNALLDPSRSSDLKTWLYGRDVLDVLQMCPKGALPVAEFSGLLKKLQPRLYSIASSLKATPGHVQLTIAQVRYHARGRARNGVCSTFLADRVQSDTAVPVFIQPTHGFKLPQDDAARVIMIGPGTGVAPFRGFLQERQATGARGKSWLFFGEQSRRESYFYENEWADLVRAGTLHRLDTAFSRDQEQKIYVQHRMRESGADLYRWLEDGAYVYVCGDASRMAKDVDAALHEVIEKHGGKSPEEAAAYVAALKFGKRYSRDVY